MSNGKSTKQSGPGSGNRFPWWVSVLLAIGSYCSLKFVIPGLQPTNPALLKLAQAAPSFAPIITILFLLLAAKQLYDIDAAEDTEDTKDEPDMKRDENPDDK